ncbi:MAG TPA: PQQ-binding-like beta-propeller repeat protein [Draconibacterium sp.]|nr:PQQ-binding-like beta-propeller repeat protein [Draconibacterium sp.]
MKYLIFLPVILVLFSCRSNKTEIYQWRGEDRKGIFNEQNLLKEWPEDGPAEIWFVEGIGDGYGSPTLTDNEIFVTGAVDSTATMFNIDLNGQIKWKMPFGIEWVESYPGSRSQPTVVDDLIYVGSGMGNLYCLSRSTGALVWEKDFVKDFNGVYPRFGHSEAPVIDAEKVFWTPGGKEHNVVALNRFTGELIWSNKGHSERSGYNPGTLIKLPSRNIFVTFSAYNLMGFDIETGELLWTHAQDNVAFEEREPGMGDTHSNSVIFDKGYIYYAAGDGNCGVKLQLSDDGTKITEEWRNIGFDSYMGGIVKIDDYLYGSATSNKYFKSIDATSGVVTDSLRLGWGAVIAADNMLYYYGQNGTLSLIELDEAGKMNQVSDFKIKRGANEHFAHPVIKNGTLYQRHGQVLMAFDVKQER